MVFSMNVFKNKKRWKNKKNVKKRKKRALNKKRKKRFFTSMQSTMANQPTNLGLVDHDHKPILLL